MNLGVLLVGLPWAFLLSAQTYRIVHKKKGLGTILVFIALELLSMILLWVAPDIPLYPKIAVLVLAIAITWGMLWWTPVLDWIEPPLRRRVQWGVTFLWVLIWDLAFDPTMFSTYFWIAAWPILLTLAWKTVDAQERDVRHLFTSLFGRWLVW